MSEERPPRRVAPVAPSELARLLREATPRILDRLGRTIAQPARWRFETRDETDIEWNGARAGPSTYALWRLALRGRAEAHVRLDIIRWSPDVVQRTDVIGHWAVRDTATTLFASADGGLPVDEVRCDAWVWDTVSGP